MKSEKNSALEKTKYEIAATPSLKAKIFAKRKETFFRRSLSAVCARLLRSLAGRQTEIEKRRAPAKQALKGGYFVFVWGVGT